VLHFEEHGSKLTGCVFSRNLALAISRKGERKTSDSRPDYQELYESSRPEEIPAFDEEDWSWEDEENDKQR